MRRNERRRDKDQHGGRKGGREKRHLTSGERSTQGVYSVGQEPDAGGDEHRRCERASTGPSRVPELFYRNVVQGPGAGGGGTVGGRVPPCTWRHPISDWRLGPQFIESRQMVQWFYWTGYRRVGSVPSGPSTLINYPVTLHFALRSRARLCRKIQTSNIITVNPLPG